MYVQGQKWQDRWCFYSSEVSVSVNSEKGINTSIGAEAWTSGENLQAVDD